MAAVDLPRAARCPVSGRASRAGSSGGCASRPGSARRAGRARGRRSRSRRRAPGRRRPARASSGAPLGQRPTIFAASRTRAGRVAAPVGAAGRGVDEAPEAGARPGAAGGRRGSCRCGRGRRGRSPRRRAAACSADRRRRRAAAGRCRGRTRSGSRAGTRRRGRSSRAGPASPRPSTNGCEIPSRKPNGSKPSRSDVPSRCTSASPLAASGPSARPRALQARLVPRVEEQHHVDRGPSGPPHSHRAGAFSLDVAEDPRPVRRRHPGDELVREHAPAPPPAARAARARSS